MFISKCIDRILKIDNNDFISDKDIFIKNPAKRSLRGQSKKILT